MPDPARTSRLSLCGTGAEAEILSLQSYTLLGVVVSLQHSDFFVYGVLKAGYAPAPQDDRAAAIIGR